MVPLPKGRLARRSRDWGILPRTNPSTSLRLVPPPFRQGGLWTRIATASVRTGFAMTRWFTESPRKTRRADVGIGPYARLSVDIP